MSRDAVQNIQCILKLTCTGASYVLPSLSFIISHSSVYVVRKM